MKIESLKAFDDESINKSIEYLNKVVLSMDNEKIYFIRLDKYKTMMELVQIYEKPEFMNESGIPYIDIKREVIVYVKSMPSRMNEARESINRVFVRIGTLLEMKDSEFIKQADSLIKDNKRLNEEVSYLKGELSKFIDNSTQKSREPKKKVPEEVEEVQEEIEF